MPKAHLKPVTPATVNRTVVPRRPPNASLRTREHLTEAEIERLMDVARKNRWGIATPRWCWWPMSVFKSFGTICGIWNGGSGSFGFEIRQLSTDVAIVAV